MTALLFDAGGDTLRDRPVTWTSSDTALVRVSPSGLATTRAHGTATITAVVEGVSGNALLRVLEPVAFASISPYSATIVPGGSIDLDVILTGISGSQLSDRDYVWSVGGPEVTVTANGVATGHAGGAGNTTITGTSEGITSPPITVTVRSPAFTSLVAGQAAWHTCGLEASGQAFCWGDNLEGTLGNGTFTDSGFAASGLPAPVGVLGGPFSSIGLGGGFTCGVAAAPVEAGLVYCWGAADHNKLGNGSFTDRATPTRVNGGRVAMSVVAGMEHGCLLQVDSLAYCWGTTTVEPTPVPGGIRFAQLFAGYHESCGVTADSTSFCWAVGVLVGNPQPVPGGLRFTQITLGLNHKCGIATDGATYCWGVNTYGQLGDSTTTYSSAPRAVSGGRAFVSVVAGWESTCALTTTGRAYCWGNNNFQQLGSPVGATSNIPVAVAGGLSFTQIVSGARHACGLATSAGAYCWGWNAVGQLGDGTKIDQPTPVRVLGQP